MNILDYIKENVLFLDGALGTELIKLGLKPGENSESWNITHPDEIVSVHKSYYDAGSNVVSTNTFGINGIKYSDDDINTLVKCAVKNAKAAKELSTNTSQKYIALDIGPTGKMLKPFGDLDFEDAITAFAKVIKAGANEGVDLILIETFNDCAETKAAVIAAKENCSLPIFVTNAYSEDARLMSGTSPEAMATMLEGLGVQAIGCNCSLGPKQLFPVIEKLLNSTNLPIIFKPNAGLPKLVNGKTQYDYKASFFAKDIINAVNKGVSIVGGCCGTSPQYIEKITKDLTDFHFVKRTIPAITKVSSGKDVLLFNKPRIIGERINPTGKKNLAHALEIKDIKYILNEALAQQEAGANALDINVGAAGIDEVEMLPLIVQEVQLVSTLPLQLDSANPIALEKACRYYVGKPLINSVNGKKESIEKILPIVKKYGGVIVALTLDENGIPSSVNERLKIAVKIAKAAKTIGIKDEDILFDPLAMTIASNTNSAQVTLNTIKDINNKLGFGTILGISNISYGLPNRDYITSSFFTLALSNGLKAAIANPLSSEIMKSYYSYMAVYGLDNSCLEYINYASGIKKQETSNPTQLTLEDAIIKGLKNESASITTKLLKEMPSLDIINNYIIPALNLVGEKYENKDFYLPQLLISAEASASAFEVIKNSSHKEQSNNKKILLATVKGDIHDIGKNIVKLLLENYGYIVLDLGKDVSPQDILKCAESNNIKLIGLSALMTTTLKSMEETILLIKENLIDTKVIVGGAVLTKEYALQIKADYYAKDAMETVHIANEFFKN